jgi:lactate dehydrogenase-like 2-hydroxyacid dehydrogenase
MRVAIFSSHKYDQSSFEEANGSFKHELVFFTETLQSGTASLASGFPAVCVFVNDRLDGPVLAQLAKGGTKFVALRCAGFNNVDFEAAEAHGITVMRVPAYSPYAVAEFTLGLLFALDRQVCRGWLRVIVAAAFDQKRSPIAAAQGSPERRRMPCRLVDEHSQVRFRCGQFADQQRDRAYLGRGETQRK